ncbi:MAG TPA: MarR family transcriptional regulator [Thermoplasmata archaeon]|nr:MarR family transcriptional regulator [Thermoplasmata archaeon]
MASFTPTQGRYLAFIHAYTSLHGLAPAESEIAASLCVSPPSVNQMVKMLERKGLIRRQPGAPRSIRIIINDDEIPEWGRGGRVKASPKSRKRSRRPAIPMAPPATLYVLNVFLTGGPVTKEFTNKEISRAIEIRGDQTLDQLHEAILRAYDRLHPHPYEFQLGRRPFDRKDPNFGIAAAKTKRRGYQDARQTRLDELNLKPDRVFGYWFDFGDGWYHLIRLERIEEAIPTVTYPRVIRRVGKSPPQYFDP